MLTPEQPPSPRQKVASLIILGAILLGGGALRFAGIGAGLPLVFFHDEVDMITHARGITRGDLNPHMFVWGDLPFYQLRAATVVMDGLAPVLRDRPLTLSDDYYLARAISAAFSLATVLVVFFLGKEFGGWAGGLLGAAFMAFTTYPAVAAHYATSEPILGFWSTLAILGLVRWREGRRYGMALFGVGMGLAAATKYNAAALAVLAGVVAVAAEWPARREPPGRLRMMTLSAATLACAALVVVGLARRDSLQAELAGWTTTGQLQPYYAHLFHRLLLLGATAALVAGLVTVGAWLRFTPCVFAARVATSPHLLKPLALAVVVFFAVSPYALLDFPAFAQGVGYSLRKQNLGALAGYAYGSRSYTALGEQSGAPDVLYYFRAVWTEFGPGGVACLLIGLLPAWRRRPSSLIPCAALIVATFAMMISARYHGVRYLYPIWGLLAALAGAGAAWVVWLAGDRLRRGAVRLAVTAALAALLVVPMALRTRAAVRAEFLTPDTRTAALQWLQQHYGPGTPVVRERATLSLELAGAGFQVHETDELFEEKTLAQWEGDGVRVVLLGEERRRFYEAHPDQFPDVLQEYECLAKAGRLTSFRPGDGMKGPVIEAYELP